MEENMRIIPILPTIPSLPQKAEPKAEKIK